MKLYNTLTRKVEAIEPLSSDQVTIYTCGPTVYDYPHIGNWFTFIRYDLLVRALQQEGLNPKWVMNITDVGHLVSDADEGEDKLEKGARREGKTAWDVADYYSQYFLNGLKRLNISKPTHLPKATEHIDEQIELIKALESKGYTYVIDDGVYYDTSKFEGYAAFARLDLDDLQAGARITHNTNKRNPSDFALWKFSPKDAQRDMEWDSPWGKGFPGWHLECSAMSMKYLGDTMDIHAGGIDHVPVHHTNEIAQSEAVTDKRFANYWMHSNHISIDGDKISKSLNNGITLEDIENKGYTLDALRYLILSSHYRTQSKFSWDTLSSAESSLRHIRSNLNWVFQTKIESADMWSGQVSKLLTDSKHRILEHLRNDLNTPLVVAEIHDTSSQFIKLAPSKEQLQMVMDYSNFIDSILGIKVLIDNHLEPYQLDLLEEREKARLQKDWDKADALRQKLENVGIIVKDTPNGVVWEKAQNPAENVKNDLESAKVENKLEEY